MPNKKGARYVVTQDITFCEAQGDSGIGCNVCLSFKQDPEYVRVEFLSDRIKFSPVDAPADDDCYYTRYVHKQKRLFIPKPFIECYKTVSGESLFKNKVERIVEEKGYSARVNKIKDIKLADYGIFYDEKDIKNNKDYVERDIIRYDNRVAKLSAFISAYKQTDYYIVEVQFGKNKAAVITPVDKKPEIPTRAEITQIVGINMQFCYCNRIRFYVERVQNIVPSHWYKTETDYKNRDFIVTVNNKNETIMIRPKDLTETDEPYAEQLIKEIDKLKAEIVALKSKR